MEALRGVPHAVHREALGGLNVDNVIAVIPCETKAQAEATLSRRGRAIPDKFGYALTRHEIEVKKIRVRFWLVVLWDLSPAPSNKEMSLISELSTPWLDVMYSVSDQRPPIKEPVLGE